MLLKTIKKCVGGLICNFLEENVLNRQDIIKTSIHNLYPTHVTDQMEDHFVKATLSKPHAFVLCLK